MLMCAPLPLIAVDPAAATAGSRISSSWIPACRVTATSAVVSRFARTTPRFGPASWSSWSSWVAASGVVVISRRRSLSELSSCAASWSALSAKLRIASPSSAWVWSTVCPSTSSLVVAGRA